MTNLIIHPNKAMQNQYLLNQVNQLIGKSYSQIAQLHNNPDIHIIELVEQSNIGIDEVKALQKKLIYQPFQERYQIGIVFHSQNLTTEAQNAFLKTLEEPGERTVYYLLVSNEKTLLDTIISRSIKHYVRQVDPLNHEPTIEHSEQDSDFYVILEKELHEQFKYVEELIEADKKDKSQIHRFLTGLAQYYRTKLSSALSQNDINQIQEIKPILIEIMTAQERIRRNVNRKLALENVLLTIANSVHG